MDLVLGISMTSAAVRWVLVEGTTGEGATISRGAFDLDDAVTPDDLLDVLLVDEADNRMHAIGLTWTNEAEDAASGVLEALRARGRDNVITVSELEAGDVLASGIAGIAEYDDVAVCIVEPDAAVVAVVDADGATVDRVSRPSDGTDVIELPSSVMTMLELEDWRPDAIFVVGSADDLDLIKSTLEDVTDAPVFSAAEADLALARGAALASARAVNGLETAGSHTAPRVRALTAVLVAAAVTFVISLSVAVGLSLTPSSPEQPIAATPQPTSEVPRPPGPEPASKISKLTASIQAARIPGQAGRPPPWSAPPRAVPPELMR